MNRPFLALLCLLGAMVLQPMAAMAADEAACPIELKIIMEAASPPTTPISVTQYLNAVVPENPEILVLGDSIAYNLASPIASATNATVANLAGSGDTIQSGMWRLGYFDSQLSRIDPRVIFVATGSNSIYIQSCAIIAGFKMYLGEIRAKFPSSKLVVLNILPRGADFKAASDNRAGANKLLGEVVSSVGGDFVEIEDFMISCGISSPETPSAVACAPNMTCQYFEADNIHPSALGIEVILNRLLPALLPSS